MNYFINFTLIYLTKFNGTCNTMFHKFRIISKFIGRFGAIEVICDVGKVVIEMIQYCSPISDYLPVHFYVTWEV